MTVDSHPKSGSRLAEWLITAALLVLWTVGLRDAVLGGFNPGYTKHDPSRPYPLHDVLITCGIITGEAALLYGLLRPRSFDLHRGRVFLALGVFVVLWIADFLLFSAATDLPGFCYSNGFFLLLTVGFLAVLALIVRLGSRAY